MAIVTAAIAAVTAAATTISAAAAGAATIGAAVAATASAVSAVGVVVGAVGSVMAVVGGITGNKDLLKIGGMLALGGTAAGVAGWAVGGIANAGGIGNWLKSGVDSVKGAVTPKAAGLEQEALGKGIVASTNPQAAANMAKQGISSNAATQEALGRGIQAGTQMPPNLSGTPGSPVYTASPTVTPMTQSSLTASRIDPLSFTAPKAPVQLGAPTPIPTPGAPSPQITGTMGSFPPNAAPPPGMFATGIQPGSITNMPTITPPAAGSSISSWWSGLDPTTKAHLALAGGQGLSGMLGGMFESMSASERLELDQLMNQQRQAQVEEMNRRSSYAPLVTFNQGGLLTQPGRA